MKDYVGKFVVLEKIDADASQYGNGEYFCIRQTPNSLVVIGTGGDYYSSESKAKMLTGKDGYAVISAVEDSKCTRALLDELRSFASAKGGRYTSNAYSRAKYMVTKLEKILADQEGCVEPSTSNVYRVCVPEGVKKIEIVL